MTDICQCCGQTLPPTPPAVAGMTTIQFAIFYAIAKAGPQGITTERLFSAVYRDGGPLTGPKIIKVHIGNIRRKLPQGWKIVTTGGARYAGHYSLTKPPEP